MIGGYAIAAADGHWASVVHKWPTIPSEKLGIRKDGKLLTATVPPGATRHEGEELGNGIIGVSGNLLAHACDNTNEQICVWDGFNLKQIYDTQVPMWGATLKNDYIMYGGGPVRGITPDGEDVNLTLNSGLGEGVGQLFTVNGAMWVSTIVYEDSLDPTTFGYIYMRPWGQSSGFVIRGDPAGQLDIKQVGTDLRIAFANAVGHLTVVTIPVNTPRISLNGISTPVCTGSSSGIDIGVNTDTENVDTRIENSTPKDTDTSDTSTPPRTTGPNTPTPPTPTNTDSQVSYNTYGGSTASSTPGSYRVFTTLPPPAPTPAGGSQTSYSDGVSGTPTPDDFETGDRSFTPSPTPSTNTAPDSVNTGMDSTPPTPATDDEPSGRSKWIIIIGAIILLAVIFFMWRRFSNKSS
jgi:hypothetical protein